ncbi:MAG: hypothetical protein HS104_09600 [Polyangiaceae bacterium]|nr:hypothetical protein [Polyangiaceae bacterium]MCE7890761.1 hypothetical protein [Sorangiineae bacterium PRO1]MCL4754341.1 hypothetical protein [Myxococcales bacterium]
MAHDDAMLVTMTRAELRELVRGEVDSALAEALAGARKPPALLSRAALADALGISLPTVDRMRREQGFPQWGVVGEAPRFELAAVLGWLRRRGDAGGDEPALRVVKGGRGG